MTRNKSEASGSDLQQISEEIKALTELVRELSEKLDSLQVTDTADNEKETSKETTKEKKEGIFAAGDSVYLKSKSKYGKKGDRGRVEHIGKVFITVRLESGKTTTRQPQNLGHVL